MKPFPLLSTHHAGIPFSTPRDVNNTIHIRQTASTGPNRVNGEGKKWPDTVKGEGEGGEGFRKDQSSRLLGRCDREVLGLLMNQGKK